MTGVRLEIVRAHEDGEHDLEVEVASRLGLPLEDILEVAVVRRALDARRRLPAPVWRLIVEVTTKAPVAGDVRGLLDAPRPRPRQAPPRAAADAPPVAVVGAGPAGLFAAWQLAESGAKVHLIERGKPVETRARDCGRLRTKGLLDEESNLCFGEGGAGTYSDGKLYTRKKDPVIREVLERLVEVGAPPRILVDAKPHVGTNLLFRVLRGLRARLIELGVDIQFQTRMNDLRFAEGRIAGLDLTTGALDAPRVVLAIGHSARDTFEVLLGRGVPMESKPFAVGVRAEHPQPLIDACQYRAGEVRPSSLPPADYRLAHTTDGRGVYSFCMCPGGMVVPTVTEPEALVVNGMSSARRSSPYANSGLVAQVNLQDIARAGFSDGPLAGVEFQRHIERAAFTAGGGGYRAPAVRASDFLARRVSGELPATRFRPGLTPADLDEVLPAFITRSLRDGLRQFDRTIPGYGSSQATLIAAETRTSSPIRIPRDAATFEVPGFAGLFVAGEGPGYAGGIVSAAADGMKVARAILGQLETAP